VCAGDAKDHLRFPMKYQITPHNVVTVVKTKIQANWYGYVFRYNVRDVKNKKQVLPQLVRQTIEI